MNKLKVMVIDDSVLYRKVLTDALGTISDVEVVDTANSGTVALSKLERIKVDFVTLDFEMPGLNGIQTLIQIKKKFPNVEVIMVSTCTMEGAEVTFKALENGALDYITKPECPTVQQNINFLSKEFIERVSAIRVRKKSLAKQTIFERHGTTGSVTKPETKVMSNKVTSTKNNLSIAHGRMQRLMKTMGRVEVVVIAVSTGGPSALSRLIPLLPDSLRVPVLVVQHMPATFTNALARNLDGKSSIKVVEANDGMVMEKGTVYIAPGGQQMKAVKENNISKIVITDDPPVNNCKPSADYMINAIKNVYKNNVLGVILTGMGRDGANSLKALHDLGCKVIAQDEKTCVVYGMPKEAVKLGAVDVQLPIEKIAAEIVDSV
jgi:two-component system chemotaxis response regulator CheB